MNPNPWTVRRLETAERARCWECGQQICERGLVWERLVTDETGAERIAQRCNPCHQLKDQAERPQ